MPTPRENFEAFALTLQQHEIVFQDISDDDRCVLRVGYKLSNIDDLDSFFFFDDTGETMHYGSSVIARAPKDRTESVLRALNELNVKYRWLTFYLDNENDVMASADHILSPNTVGDTCFELLQRSINIIDEAYPTLMRAIWS